MPIRSSVTTLFAVFAFPLTTQGGTSCRPADRHSANYVAYVEEFVASTDSATVALRQSLGLGSVTDGQISLLTSGTACRKLMDALNELAGTPGAARTGYVVRVGMNHYFVRDLKATAGEYNPTFVFDSKYKLLKALLGA